MTTEASIRAQHRYIGSSSASGYATSHRCSCGAVWHDADVDCPALEAALDELRAEQHEGATR
jgi:hypothetical protein